MDQPSNRGVTWLPKRKELGKWLPIGKQAGHWKRAHCRGGEEQGDQKKKQEARIVAAEWLRAVHYRGKPQSARCLLVVR